MATDTIPKPVSSGYVNEPLPGQPVAQDAAGNRYVHDGNNWVNMKTQEPYSEPPSQGTVRGAGQIAKDASGNSYTQDEGGNWVNIATREPYKEPAQETPKEPGVLDKVDQGITGALAPNPKNYESLAKTNLIEAPKTLGRELYSGAKAGLGMIPGAVKAFTEPAQTEEEKKTQTEHPIVGKAATGLGRMLVDPIKNAADWYGKAFRGQVPDPTGQALSVAPEAIGSAAGQVVAGKAASEVVPKAATNAIEAAKSEESFVGPKPDEHVAAAAKNVAAMQKAVAPLQKAHDAALAEYDTYKASQEAGVPVPEKVVEKVLKAREALLEQQKHLDLAEQAHANAKAGRPNVPNQAAPAAALAKASTPATAPAAQTGEALGGTPLRNPLGEVETPKVPPARETGEALGTLPAPERPITPEEVKSSPGTSMSPKGRPEAPKEEAKVPEAPKEEAKKAKVEPKASKEELKGEFKYHVAKEPGLVGAEYKEEGETSAEELHPVVKEQISKLSNENLKKLGKEYGLNPDEYNFQRREVLREGGSKHPVERHKFIDDLMEALPDKEKLELGRRIKADEGSEGFSDRDQSSKAKAERAQSYFPKLKVKEDK